MANKKTVKSKQQKNKVVDLNPPKDKVQALEFMKSIQTLSELLPRARLMARLGQQYDGDRDIYEALGYDLDPEYDDYAARYERQDIATAIIDRPVDATWRGGVEVIESNDNKETKLEKAYKELNNKLKLTTIYSRVDRLTGVGRWGVLLFGLDDVKKSEDLINPVSNGQRKLLYLKPLSEDGAKIDKYVTNASDKRYGLPLVYNVKIKQPGTDNYSNVKVHHSRVIHVTDKILESEVEGVPRLKAVYNRLMDLEKLVGGSAEMFWRGARPGYQAIVDKEATDIDTSSLQDTFDEWEHKLRRILVNMGVEYKAMEQQIADPSSQVEVVIQMIAAVTGIPKRVLTGSEVGKLASNQDDNMWNDLILTRREGFAEFSVVRPFIDKCIKYKILPESNGYHLKWKDLWSPSDQEKATIAKTMSLSLANYDRAITSHSIVPPEAFFRFIWRLDDSEIELAKAMMEDYRLSNENNKIEDGTPIDGDGDV